MNAREFEKKLFALLFRTEQKLTPHFVAYQLDVSFEEAQKQLDQLAASGALRLEIDDNGGIWYEAPGVERGKEQAASAHQPQPQEQPQMRMVYAPARFGVFSMAALFFGGLILMKFLLPILLVAGVIGIIRYRWSQRRSYSSYCGHHRSFFSRGYRY